MPLFPHNLQSAVKYCLSPQSAATGAQNGRVELRVDVRVRNSVESTLGPQFSADIIVWQDRFVKLKVTLGRVLLKGNLARVDQDFGRRKMMAVQATAHISRLLALVVRSGLWHSYK